MLRFSQEEKTYLNSGTRYSERAGYRISAIGTSFLNVLSRTR